MTIENQMEHSKSYLALELMIENGWLVSGISDFASVLHKLQTLGHITLEERQNLLLQFGRKQAEAMTGKSPDGSEATR